MDFFIAWIYPLAKRHRSLRNFLLPLRRLGMNLLAKGRALRRGRKKYTPPARHASATAWISRPEAAGAYAELYPRQTLRRALPGTTEDEVHWCFKASRTRDMAPAAVAVIPGGRAALVGRQMWDRNVVAITPDDTLLTDFSAEINGPGYLSDASEFEVFTLESLPPVRKLDGTAALLAAPAGGGYYHWMFQVLPRLHLLEENGIPLRSIDRFIVNICASSYHKETLDVLGIPREKVVESQWNPHVQAETLVVATLPEEPLEWSCAFVRRSFLCADFQAQGDRPERLYVSRSGANHRRIVNEAEVETYLQEQGFATIHTEKLSVAEQARLMASARVVIGPHGAGLSNIVFCQPKTKVIELFSSSGVSTLFWGLANVQDLEYYYLIEGGPRLSEHKPYRPHLGKDMHVDVDNLAKVMKLARVDETA